MRLESRFNNWPTAIRTHEAITSFFPRLCESGLDKVSPVTNLACTVFMEGCLALKPLGWDEEAYDRSQERGGVPLPIESATRWAIASAAALFLLAFYFNSLP